MPAQQTPMQIRARRGPTRPALVATLVAAAFVGSLLPAGSAPAGSRSPLEQPEATHLVRLLLPGRDALDAVADAGFDLAGNLARVPDGFEVDALVTDDERAALEGMGARVLAPDEVFRWPEPEESRRQAAALLAMDLLTPPPGRELQDAVKVGRVDYFDTQEQGFISVEAKTSEGASSGVFLILLWDAGMGTPMGSGGLAVMNRFVDSGEYMYHRLLTPVNARPSQVLVLSTSGGQDTGEVSDWLYEVDPLLAEPGYEYSFVDGYMHPTQLFGRIEQLALAYPDLAEIVALPNPTNGYRRKAQAILGSGDSAVVVTSVAWGHEGGNDVTVELVPPAEPDQPLGVEVEGSAIRVHLATGSTAADVVAALNDEAAPLVSSHTYRGNAGTGIVQPEGPVALTDFLTAPESIPRDPFPVRALRIGTHRDGSETGVLIIAQDHAREWVTPLVAVEAAERLLRNYDNSAETRRIVDNVDIFIVPSNNPDGSHYSFFDFNSQRRNMTNHCPETNADPGRRNAWGVDLNRNYRVGSAADGYSGGSFSCISNTYMGPGKLSEPEAQNVVALVEDHPNIKFFMTVHSSGGQLFWQPGAYIAEGRVTTPRPEMRDEAYYWQMAERILSHVKTYQDTVVRPDNVGGSADVLYSSAGNVREDLYNNYGIYAFGWEIGGSVWNPTTRTWVSGSFQPPWERAYGEAMEYANGVMEMFRIAADFGDDDVAPTTTLVPGEGSYSGPVEVSFTMSEPATIYYTTDGSRPSLTSSRYRNAGIREGPEALLVTETTTFKWFSVDPAGNFEDGYDPDGTEAGYREATVTITD